MDAINLPASIALPTSFGAPAVPLQPGQVVQALVLELLQSGAFRLQLPQAVLDVRSDVPLTPGGTVTLAVQGSGSALKLDILAQTMRAAPPRKHKAVRRPRRPMPRSPLRRCGVRSARRSSSAAPAFPRRRAFPRSRPSRPRHRSPRARLRSRHRARSPRRCASPPRGRAGSPRCSPTPSRRRKSQRCPRRCAPPSRSFWAARSARRDPERRGREAGVRAFRRAAGAAPCGRDQVRRECGDRTGWSSSPAAPPAGDLKAALLVLRQALKTWAGQAAPPAEPALAKPQAVATIPRPPPRYARAG